MPDNKPKDALAQFRQDPDFKELMNVYEVLEQTYSQSLDAAGLRRKETSLSVVNTAQVTLSVRDSSTKES